MKTDGNDILEVMDQADAVNAAAVNGPAPRIRAMVSHLRKGSRPFDPDLRAS